jgi:NAD-dependent dihydropyrimidine dehydrogenase PreA subunit
MKSIVIYDSLSGNTKKIAEAIHRGMSEAGDQCDIARIKDVDTQALAGYDLVGLGSYIINMKEPLRVTYFIQHTMRSLEGKHAFAFCTHGALPGYYMARVVPAMIQRGLTVIGWNDWFGGVWYPVTPKPYFTDGHPDAIDLKEAEDFGREMVERSRRISQGENQLIPVLPKGKEYEDIYVPLEVPPLTTDSEAREVLMAIAGIEFKVDQERCKYPKCTLCIDNCPQGSIDFSVSPPNFNITCQKCYHCEQICPNGAIGADYMPFKKAHDPVTVSLLQKSLEVFEARGRFRRLVPMEDIGWDTPAWKYKKPPRYKPA